MSVPHEPGGGDAAPTRPQLRWNAAGALGNVASLIGFVGGLLLVIEPGAALFGDQGWLWFPAIPTAVALSYGARKLVALLVRRG